MPQSKKTIAYDTNLSYQIGARALLCIVGIVNYPLNTATHTEFNITYEIKKKQSELRQNCSQEISIPVKLSRHVYCSLHKYGEVQLQ